MNELLPKFRWKLISPTHPDIQLWAWRVKVNYARKKILIKIFDDPKGLIFNWIQDLCLHPEIKKHTLSVAHVAPTGEIFAKTNFANVYLLQHCTDYDVGNGDFLSHTLVIPYENVSRENNLDIV